APTTPPSTPSVPEPAAAPAVVNASSNVAFRTADALPPILPITNLFVPALPDTPQIVTGSALRQLFSGSPGDVTLLAQMFQGRTELGALRPDLFEILAEYDANDEPLLVYRDGRWYVIDLSAPGGYRNWDGLPGAPGAEPSQTFDADTVPILAVAPVRPTFSQQIELASHDFSRRASLLDSALSAF
ncbi:MAG: hypothetical protein WCH83_18205, partial [Alphaproteobacteria bacterium]